MQLRHPFKALKADSSNQEASNLTHWETICGKRSMVVALLSCELQLSNCFSNCIKGGRNSALRTFLMPCRKIPSHLCRQADHLHKDTELQWPLLSSLHFAMEDYVICDGPLASLCSMCRAEQREPKAQLPPRLPPTSLSQHTAGTLKRPQDIETARIGRS